MTRSLPRRLSWLTMMTAALIATVMVFVLDWPPSFEEVVSSAGVLGYGLVGAVVAFRRPANPIGWIYQVIGALLAFMGLASFWTTEMLSQGPHIAAWEQAVAWFYSWAWIPLLALATTFTFLLYPSGLPSQRWRPVLWLSSAVTATVTLLVALLPTIDVGDPTADQEAFTVDNPVAPDLLRGLDISQQPGAMVGLVLVAIAVGCGLAGVWAVIIRTWRSRGIERLQMRLFAVVILLVPVQVIVGGVVPGFVDSAAGDVSFALLMFLIPVSSGIAILRYHLYDIDQVIGRTTAYALVTGVLLTVYVLVVTSVGRLLPESSELGVAVATLTAAALFRPVLRWARRVVARRFNREKYDADHVVEEFARGLRDEVDSSVVQGELLAVLERTLQPSGSALWLRGPKP